MLFVVWPVVVVSVAFLGAILFTIGSLAAFLVARRPPLLDSDPDVWAVPIKKWPEIGGVRIWPLSIILGLLGAYALVSYSGIVLTFTIILGKVLLYVVLPLIGLALLIWLLCAFLDSDTWKMTKAFFKAKKERVCPMIRFTADGKPEGGG